MFICIEYFFPTQSQLSLKASAESRPSGFGSAQLALLFIIIYYCQAQTQLSLNSAEDWLAV